MFEAKLRQVRIGLGHGNVTVGYPLAPREPDPAYRGHVVVDTEVCTGCGGCAAVCPSRCIVMTDPDRETRVIVRHLDRCILCSRCVDACAYGALQLAAEWETGTRDRADLLVEQRLFMGSCDRCGRCYVPAHPLDRLQSLGLVPVPAVAAAAGPGREDAWKA